MIYIGSYRDGVSVWGADLRPAAPTVALPAASYLVRHPRMPALYAVDERDDGGVSSLAIGPDGALTVTSRQPSGGAAPCHLAVSADGRHLLCANYGTGSVAVFPIGSDGTLAARSDLVTHRGDGAPHAHHVSVRGTEVTAVDLGTDTLYGYRLDVAGRLTATWSVSAGAGTGPRHLVATPDGHRYVADEVAATVSVYEPGPAGLRLVHRRPASRAGRPEATHPSEIALSADGRFLYVANRGPDTIATFAVRGYTLEPVAETPTGGAWPRHFAIDGDLMYVANQRADRVTVLRPDPDTGVPRPTGDDIQVPEPGCVLPLTTDPQIAI